MGISEDQSGTDGKQFTFQIGGPIMAYRFKPPQREDYYDEDDYQRDLDAWEWAENDWAEDRDDYLDKDE